jgi:hypothetical protein
MTDLTKALELAKEELERSTALADRLRSSFEGETDPERTTQLANLETELRGRVEYLEETRINVRDLALDSGDARPKEEDGGLRPLPDQLALAWGAELERATLSAESLRRSIESVITLESGVVLRGDGSRGTARVAGIRLASGAIVGADIPPEEIERALEEDARQQEERQRETVETLERAIADNKLLDQLSPIVAAADKLTSVTVDLAKVPEGLRSALLEKALNDPGKEATAVAIMPDGSEIPLPEDVEIYRSPGFWDSEEPRLGESAVDLVAEAKSRERDNVERAAAEEERRRRSSGRRLTPGGIALASAAIVAGGIGGGKTATAEELEGEAPKKDYRKPPGQKDLRRYFHPSRMVTTPDGKEHALCNGRVYHVTKDGWVRAIPKDKRTKKERVKERRLAREARERAAAGTTTYILETTNQPETAPGEATT